MVTEHGVVVWTRGASRDNDLRPLIREWFREEGFRELAFEAESEGFGVGVVQRDAVCGTDRLPERLFTFQR
jgi:hypothetical protein